MGIEWPALQLESRELPQAVYVEFDDRNIKENLPGVGVRIEPFTIDFDTSRGQGKVERGMSHFILCWGVTVPKLHGTIIQEGEDAEDEDEEQGAVYRLDVALSYGRERKEMGRPYTHFTAIGPLVMLERKPDFLSGNFIPVRPEPIASQTIGPISENQVVTEKKAYANSTMNHTSGGWPKEINDFDMDAVQRWRKKMIKSEDLNAALPKFFALTERCLIQNNSLNIYERYFESPEWEEPEPFSPPSVSLLGRFPDRCKSNVRPVQQIHLEPFDGTHLVGAYGHFTYMRRDYSVETDNYIWDITRLPEPIRTIDATVPAVKLQYNPKIPKVVLGGLITGQLCYWDLRSQNAKPVAFSDVYKSLSGPPTSILWLSSKSGYDCFASSSDGQIIWYDIRNFNEPTESLILDMKPENEEPSILNALGISVLEFEPTIPTKFMVGLETGSVLVGNRKGKTISEKISEPYYAFPSPVRALSRNPSYMKCFLCIGDCSFKIMAEDCKESYIFWSDPCDCWYTGGKWSEQKNSTFFLTRMDGTLDIWDFVMKVDGPILSEKVSDKPLRCLDIHKNGRLVLTGSDNGIISMYEVSSHFYTQDKNEKNITIAMFDRESKREKMNDARNREVKLQQKQVHTHSIVTEDNTEALKEKITKDYLKALDDYDQKMQKAITTEEDHS